MKNCTKYLVNATLLTVVMVGSNASKAGISPYNPDLNAFPELLLVVFDKAKEVSYTKDLGLLVMPHIPIDPAAANIDPKKNFFVQAQQDGGYQKFFDSLNKDDNFKKFLDVSKNIGDQVWGVYAASNPEFTVPGGKNFFTTLTVDPSTGGVGKVVNPEYTKLRALKNGVMADAADFWYEYVTDLNNGVDSVTGASGSNIFNSHYKEGGSVTLEDFVSNGSSFDVKGEFKTYFPKSQVLMGPNGGIGSELTSTVNPVNSSSWFYYVTPSSANVGAPVLVDEFDNLSNDGYWGLAVDSKGDYILSFTMEAHIAAATTAQGLVRRNRTDFSALYGGVRSLAAPSDEFMGWQPSGNFGNVSAVPEPATYGLFGLGLAALAWRRRQAARQA